MKTDMIAAIVYTLCIVAAHAETTEGLIGHWKFDGSANLGLDSSGRGNHGTVTEADVTYVVAG